MSERSQPETSTRTRRERQERSDFIHACHDNKIIVEVDLSRTMAMILRRHFENISRSAYLMRFYCRIGPGRQVEEEIAQDIMALITAIDANISKKITVADQMLSHKGIRLNEGRVEKRVVTIIDPLAHYYLQALVKANQLETKLTALWLATLIDDQQKRSALTEIDNSLRSITAKARNLSLGVRERVMERRAQRQATQSAPESVVDTAPEAPLVEAENRKDPVKNTKRDPLESTESKTEQGGLRCLFDSWLAVGCLGTT